MRTRPHAPPTATPTYKPRLPEALLLAASVCFVAFTGVGESVIVDPRAVGAFDADTSAGLCDGRLVGAKEGFREGTRDGAREMIGN